jgi:mevalonate kinase
VSQRFLEIIARCKLRQIQSQNISEGTDLFTTKDNEEEAAQIGQLFRINHSLLNALGVGHPSLDAVSTVSALKGYVIICDHIYVYIDLIYLLSYVNIYKCIYQ